MSFNTFFDLLPFDKTTLLEGLWVCVCVSFSFYVCVSLSMHMSVWLFSLLEWQRIPTHYPLLQIHKCTFTHTHPHAHPHTRKYTTYPNTQTQKHKPTHTRTFTKIPDKTLHFKQTLSKYIWFGKMVVKSVPFFFLLNKNWRDCYRPEMVEMKFFKKV